MIINTHLGCSIYPNFRLTDFVPIRKEEVSETLHGPRQSEATDHEGEQEEDGERGREVDNLARGRHALPQAEVDNDPGQHQEAEELKSDVTHVVNTLSHLEHAMTETITQFAIIQKINRSLDYKW